MAKYRVPFNGYASTTMDIETDETDPVKIADLAQRDVYVSLCHRCANNVDVGDEWEPVTHEGKPTIYKLED